MASGPVGKGEFVTLSFELPQGKGGKGNEKDDDRYAHLHPQGYFTGKTG